MQRNHVIRQFLITPTTGKKLIAKSLVHIPEILRALKKQTLVIIAGTTNGFVARELLQYIHQSDGFVTDHFHRGVILPPQTNGHNEKSPAKKPFPGDVIIENGTWVKGKTIFDVSEHLVKGDIIMKGANALDVENRKAGILIGHPRGGTIQSVISSVIGKRVELYIPVGLEKRVPGNLDSIAAKLNSPNASGLRMLPVSGNIVTELDAIRIMTGAFAELVAAGGICGAEGSYYIAVSGNEEQVENAEKLIQSL